MCGKRAGCSAWRRLSHWGFCCCLLPICIRASVPRLRAGGKMNKLIRSLLWCALLLRADFEPSSWKFRRPLPVEAKVPIAVVNIDRGIYVHSQPGLSDLRVVSGQGELPYVLERMSGSRQHTEVSSNQP